MGASEAGENRGERWSTRSLHLAGLEPGATAQLMKRVDLSGRAGGHGEAWLQAVMHQFPQILPVHDIEPGFGHPIPLCREMPVRTGFVDNVFATGDGDLVLVECKLWRNPQARREVVAQIIDYAHCLATWTYAELDGAVRKARAREEGDAAKGIYELVGGDEALDEPSFVDAVSRNLRLGRLLLLVVGDGIHESAETLADYLQMHAGFHFTLGLVEAPVHQLSEGGYIVSPRILARTVNIERGIVRVEDGKPVVLAAPLETQSARTTSISQERMSEALGQIDPSLPDRLRGFVDRLSEYGVFLEPASRSLVLRWPSQTGRKVNLGAITSKGELQTGYANWEPNALGRVDLGHAYQEAVARAVGGEVRKTPTPANWYVAKSGAAPRLDQVLANEDEWRAAIAALIDGLREVLDER